MQYYYVSDNVELNIIGSERDNTQAYETHTLNQSKVNIAFNFLYEILYRSLQSNTINYNIFSLFLLFFS